MTRHRLLALGLLVAAACSGSPAGPGGGDGPTGRIFYWGVPPGATVDREQVMVISVAGGEPERIPTWFLDPSEPTVDTAGSVVAFMAPAYEIATVSPDDSTIFHRLGREQYRRRPLVSLDGRQVAMIFSPPLGVNAEVRLVELATGTERVAGVLPNFSPGSTPDYRIYAWFPGNDSVLVGARDVQSFRYFVVQTDGTRLAPFDFIPALEAQYVALSADGHFLALSGTSRDTTGRSIEIWDLARRTLTRDLSVSFPVWDVAWSPDGGYLAYASGDLGPLTSGLYILQVSTGEETPLLPPANRYALNLSWAR